MHEEMRVFHDRLLSDRTESGSRSFLHGRCPGTSASDGATKIFLQREDAHVWHFLSAGEDIYSEFTGTQAALVKVLDGYLEEYNMTNTTSQLDLVFFADAVSHIARINRVLRQPRGLLSSLVLVEAESSHCQSLRVRCASTNVYR